MRQLRQLALQPWQRQPQLEQQPKKFEDQFQKSSIFLEFNEPLRRQRLEQRLLERQQRLGPRPWQLPQRQLELQQQRQIPQLDSSFPFLV